MNSNSGVNKVFLVGKVTRQPRRQIGTALCFTLTTKENHEKNGETVEQTEDHLIKVPGNKLQGEIELGQLLHIEGKLQTTSFVDEQLVKRYKTEVICIRIQPLSQ